MLEVTSIVCLAVGGDGSVLYDLFCVLAAAALVAIVLQRVRLAAIPGYLITGAVVGPGALGVVDSPESLSFISYLAIILLMFGIGLHLDLGALKRGLGSMVTTGIGSCALSILLLLPLGWIGGTGLPAALALAMALSLSSTAVVLRIIAARRDLRRPSGRLSFAILIVQDLLVVGMLVLLPVLARWQGGDEGPSFLPSYSWMVFRALVSGAGIAGMVILGRLILPHLLRECARARSREVMMILSVAVAIGAAGVTKMIGLSAEMGAFIAGFLLSSTVFRHELRGQIGPLRDLFLAVFFTTVGMKLDVVALVDGLGIVLGGGLLLCVAKSLSIGFAAWCLGASPSVAVIVGCSLAQAGEFSLVLIDRAVGLALLDETLAAQAIAIVVMSLILTPYLVSTGHRLARRFGRLRCAPWIRQSHRRAESAAPPERSSGPSRSPVIIAGFGTIGRIVAERLSNRGTPTIIVELNTMTVREEARRGRRIVYGNVADPEILHSLDIERAAALVLTIPDDEAALRACQSARHLAPDLFIAVRTTFPKSGRTATELGANHVAVEEFAVADDLGRAILSAVGVDEDTPEEKALVLVEEGA